ncbi:T9SS type A sorting domain-containing protein [uncultured Algibacter sp.]|uniref:T9SS type A sorting domain-containing protein n=1 Tax=uncultured Algibacter sp. TaxID=298659 RepID=UPI002629D4AD|nr:T9SS type A sorting domain-containing protein [uncultured Algibacter sp.]
MKEYTSWLFFGFALILTNSFSQVLDRSANWPNPNWTISGNFNPNNLLNSPDIDMSFTFEYSTTWDIIYAESPPIDLRNAYNSNERMIIISGDITSRVIWLSIEYWDADNLSWNSLEFLDFMFVNFDDYLNCENLGKFSLKLNINNFSENQLLNFKYRYSFNNYANTISKGFCLKNSKITSQSVSDIPSCSLMIENPIDNEEDVSITPHIKWNVSNNESSGFLISIGLTPDGEELVSNLDIGNSTSYSPTLDYNTKYYVKVVSYNVAGLSTTCTDFISFTTQSDSLIVFEGVTGLISFNSCNNTNEYVVNVNNVGVLDGASIFFEELVINKLERRGLEGLEITLVAPDGTSVLLASKINSINSRFYLSTHFTEDASAHLYEPSAVAPYSGNYLPEGNLRDFYGVNANGDWKLKICDDGSYFYDFNKLFSWKLIFNNSFCHPPLIHNINNITSSSADFNWSTVSDVDNGYEWKIMYANSHPDSNFTPIDSGSTLSNINYGSTTSLHDDKFDYKLWIRGLCGGNEGKWSIPYAFNTNSLSKDNFIKMDYVNIFPNPIKDILSMSVDINAFYSIFDLQGKKVKKGELVNGINEIDISNFLGGVYFVKIADEAGRVCIKKLMKI